MSGEIEFIDDNDEYYYDDPQELIAAQERTANSIRALREEARQMEKTPLPYSSPKNMLPNVLKAFGRLLTCTSKDSLARLPEELTNKDVLALMNLQFKAASTLIKHIVPTLKATANLHAEIDADIEAALMDKSTEQLTIELQEMEQKLNIPKETATRATKQAVEVVDTWRQMREIMPGTTEKLKVASKQKNRTSGSPRKVRDVESAARPDRTETTLQSDSEEEAGPGS